jgi:hypothetical protein
MPEKVLQQEKRNFDEVIEDMIKPGDTPLLVIILNTVAED